MEQNTGDANSGQTPITVAVPGAIPMPRSFPDITRIEQFDGKNFRRWQERVYTVLDLHGVVDALHLLSLLPFQMLTKPRLLLGPMQIRFADIL